jgi:hypothetical protein
MRSRIVETIRDGKVVRLDLELPIPHDLDIPDQGTHFTINTYGPELRPLLQRLADAWNKEHDYV